MADYGYEVKYCYWGHLVPLVECDWGIDRVRKGLALIEDYFQGTQKEHLRVAVDLGEGFHSAGRNYRWPKFEHRNALQNYTWNDLPIGIPAVSTVCDILKVDSLDFKNAAVIELVNNALTTYAHSFNMTSRIIDLYEPSTLVLFNGRYPSYAGSRAAGICRSIKLLFHERGGNISQFKLLPTLPHNLDSYASRIKQRMRTNLLTDNTGCSSEGDAWFRNRIAFSSDDEAYTRRMIKKKFQAYNDESRIYSFFVSSSDEIASLPPGTLPPSYWHCQVEAICDLISAIKTCRPNAFLCVRLHPNLLNKNPQEIERLSFLSVMENVLVISPQDNLNSYSLAWISDSVFTFMSTIGIEAAYMGKRVYTLSPTYYDNLAVTYPLKTYSDIKEMLETEGEQRLNSAELLSIRYRCATYGSYESSHGYDFMHYEATGVNSGKFLCEYL